MSYATKKKGDKYLDRDKKIKRPQPIKRLAKDWWVKEVDCGCLLQKDKDEKNYL
jgi:hypothetical protein